MTLYRTYLRNLAEEILAAYAQPSRVLVGQRWPVEDGQLPALLVDMRGENKTTANRTQGPNPTFDVQATLAVRARVAVFSEPMAAQFGEDHGRAIEAVCDLWLGKIQDGLLSDPVFPRKCQVQSVQTETAAETTAEQLIAEVMVTFTLVWSPEEYPPRVNDDFASMRLRVDAIDPADPNGTYPPVQGFPDAAPPPRVQGPDGRAEVGADLPIPNPEGAPP